MRPPDDLHALKHMPLSMAAGGAIAPVLWLAATDIRTALTAAPLTALLLLLYGLFLKYRTWYSPRDAIWALPVALLFLGSLMVGATTGLVMASGEPGLTNLAILLAAVLIGACLCFGYIHETRLLRPARDGIPERLSPLLDMERAILLPAPSSRPAPAVTTMAFVGAVGVNIPLMIELGGWERISVMWIVSPVLAGLVGYMFGLIGRGLARSRAVIAIERRTGKRFRTSRIGELRELRRGFWLSRWLCNAEDLREPEPSPAAARKTAGRAGRQR